MNYLKPIFTKKENIFAVVGGTVFFIFLFFSVSTLNNWELEINLKQKVKMIYNDIEHAAQTNIEQSLIFSNFPGVVQAYQVAHSGDISSKDSPESQQAREKLRAIFNNYIAQSKSILKKPPKIHFHLPPARSLVRLWRDVQTKKGDISDDLSTFRFTVLDINGNKDTTKIGGIEIGRGGFALRGISPVYDGAKRLGSVEVLTSFKDFFNNLKSTDLETLGLYMNASYLKVATKLKDPKKNPLVGKEFVRVSSTEKEETDRYVTYDILRDAKKKLVVKSFGNHELIAFPIRDYVGKQIGVGVYILDISQQYRAIWFIRLAYLIGIFLFVGAVFWLTYSMDQVHKNHADGLEKSRNELEIKITNIVKKLDQNYQQVNEAVSSLDESSNVLSSSSTVQAAATEEAVAAMEEISSMIQQTNEYGNKTTAIASDANEQVAQGLEVMQKLRESMNSINETRKELALILDLIRNISDKTKIINSIVVKTELLSFNASIEAARAAEYGKGFSVVAEEIGNLARLSGKSAKDIEVLLNEGMIKVDDGIGVIEEKINLGEKVVEECLAVFDKIEEFNSTLSANIDSISNATNEQTKGVEQTTLAMNDISKSTQENLKITTNTSALSQSVKREMDVLKDTIEQLKKINE